MFARGRVGPFAGRAPGDSPSAGRTGIGLACCGHRPPANNGPRDGRSRGNVGTLPRPARRGGVQAPRHFPSSMILRDEKGPPSPAGQVGWLFVRLLGGHCRRIDGGRRPVRGLGVDHDRFIAVSSRFCAGRIVGGHLVVLGRRRRCGSSGTLLRAKRLGQRASLGEQRFRLYGHIALLEVLDAIRGALPLRFGQRWRMRALVTRPKKLSTVGIHPAAAMSRSTVWARLSAWANALGRRFHASCTALTDRLTTWAKRLALLSPSHSCSASQRSANSFGQHLRPTFVPNADRLSGSAIIQPRRLGPKLTLFKSSSRQLSEP